MEEIVERPASIADLERLEADIEEALISHIDKPADDSIIADLERRKLDLICEIERLRRRPEALGGKPCSPQLTSMEFVTRPRAAP
jgi:hypothetical protein